MRVITDLDWTPCAPVNRLSCTVMRPNRRRPSGDKAMPAWTRAAGPMDVMSRPSKRRVPDAGIIRPIIAFKVVLLPAPLEIGKHTSELQSLMRISYAVFCLKKKNKQIQH